MLVKRQKLYYVAALIWGVPGIGITIKGVAAYHMMPISEWWWLGVITMFVLAMFYAVFSKVVGRYMLRISSLGSEAPLWHTFSLRGWLLILFMMGLGLVLKHTPNIPIQFTASFYTGLGPMLIWSAVKYLKGEK